MTLYQIADSNVFTFDKSSSTLGNGVVETRGYNSDNTLSTISFGGSGTAIGNLTYTWDSNKNKTSETIGGVMSPYSFTQAGTTYDAEDRLTVFARAATSGTPQLSQSWSLSAVGDWNSVTTNGTAQSRTHGPTHELLTAGGQGVTHDTKGNMLFIPASVRANSSPLVLTWDFYNRMVSADVGADSVIDVTHQYDALGRRVARTASGSTTVFVQVDQQTICDYVSGAAPASSTYRYLYASYIDEPIVRIATSNSETTWYHRNQQYSIVACTNSSGAATERYAYTAYGLPTITDGSGTVRTSSAIGNRYTYTGREWDGVLGLYHYRARMYEATVGRFCSRDPAKYSDGLSLYRSYFSLAKVDWSGTTANNCQEGDCLITAGIFREKGAAIILHTHGGDVEIEEGDHEDLEPIEKEWIEIFEKFCKIVKCPKWVKRGKILIPSAHLAKLSIYAFSVEKTYDYEFELRCCDPKCNSGWGPKKTRTFEKTRRLYTHGFNHPYQLFGNPIDQKELEAFLRKLAELLTKNNGRFNPTEADILHDMFENAKEIPCCERLHKNSALPKETIPMQ